MVTISYFQVPYQIAFGGPNSAWEHNVDIFLDIVLLVDVVMNFITDQYSDPSEPLLSNKKIAFKYVTSYFVVDLLSFLPQLATNESYKGSHWIYCLKMLRYFRIKRSFQQIEDLFKHLGGLFKEHTSYNIRFVLIQIFQFIMTFHLMACVWIILG